MILAHDMESATLSHAVPVSPVVVAQTRAGQLI